MSNFMDLTNAIHMVEDIGRELRREAAMADDADRPKLAKRLDDMAADLAAAVEIARKSQDSMLKENLDHARGMTGSLMELAMHLGRAQDQAS